MALIFPSQTPVGPMTDRLGPVKKAKVFLIWPPFTWALPAPPPPLPLICLDFFGCGAHDFALSHLCFGLCCFLFLGTLSPFASLLLGPPHAIKVLLASLT